ncbi:uncharacterized protein LOC121865455 [Homarus americanus]|uniref:Uncharacterized protein n=1 Tax=Homarus americanus TaxID=6706 RepID=A0A8J5K4F8_HOMAM|nr:uncharacterized protein LOC121865455 [Homarus americanus]KAG7169680.1 hypothetical protein Hamer_G013302 [Homarus americanus]
MAGRRGGDGWCGMLSPWLGSAWMCPVKRQPSIPSEAITFGDDNWWRESPSPSRTYRGPQMIGTPPPPPPPPPPPDMVCFEQENRRCWLPQAAPSGPPVPPPHGPHSLYRSLEDYKPLQHISRTVHFNEYEDILKEGLKPKKIGSEHLTYISISKQNICALFFGVPGDGDAHDWYGNIRLKVEFNRMLQEIHPRVYFVDVVDFKSSSASRLLLTTRRYDNHFPRYDPKVMGGPWYRDPSGKDWYLTNARRYNSTNKNHHGHQLEFLVELNKVEYQKLLSMCEKSPVDHSQANTKKPRTCMRYNSFGNPCPSPWEAKETEERVMCLDLKKKKKKYPTTCDRLENKDKGEKKDNERAI